MLNYFWIEIKGKSVKRLLNQIFQNKINVFNIKYYEDKVILKVSYEDYKKIKKIKTICDVKIIKTSGSKKIYEDFLQYKTSIFVFIMCVFFIILLSNLTLFIKIDTNNNELKEEVRKDLENNGITLFSNKKDYNDIKKITSKIKDENDDLEWIEIENKGVITKVKVIERVENKIVGYKQYKDIVAEKSGYIRKIFSRRGEVLKNIDDYVEKGEVIISGNILRNEKLVDRVCAEGDVYAEVWYIVKANKAFKYTTFIEKEKGIKKLVLNVLGNEIVLFKAKGEVAKEREKKIFRNKIFELYVDEKKDYLEKKSIYDRNVLKKILELRAKKNILKSLNKDEYIIEQKTLKKTKENGKMYIEVFFKVYENIAKEEKLAKIEEMSELKED